MLKREDLEARRWEADGANDREGQRRYHQIDAEGRSVDTRSAMHAFPETVCDTSNRSSSITDEEDRDNSLLLAAAPKLALACLEALALTRRVVEHFAETDAPLGIAAQDVRSLLFNELTAAGVEVE